MMKAKGNGSVGASGWGNGWGRGICVDRCRGNGRGKGRAGGPGHGGGGGGGGIGQGRGMGKGTDDASPELKKPSMPGDGQPLSEPLTSTMESREREVEKLKAQPDNWYPGMRLFMPESLLCNREKQPGLPSTFTRKTAGVRLVASMDKEKCVNCGICAEVCPEDAILLDDNVVIDNMKCTGCGECLDVCMNEAIALVKAP